MLPSCAARKCTLHCEFGPVSQPECAAQDLSEQQLLLASACWLRDDLETALQGCLPRLGQLLAEGRSALPCATAAELLPEVQHAMQLMEGGACMVSALQSLLTMQAAVNASDEPPD